ncbi:MAG: glycyl-radical enzyme activating protein [Clostridia bacterium]|nr:glycyl-radical enzyme activating protein [Clostridia bacterium]
MSAQKSAGKTGVVFDIKEFAVFDGPGIRTTVFMKGCPLSCAWCHNPEGLSPAPQLMVSRAACTHCGACALVCPSPENCTACGRCIPACRGGYRKIAGETWTSEALGERLQKDADVYALSGGGVTFSGGEPLMQWGFVSSVIDRLRGIHTAIETSGFAPDDVFSDAMRRCDLILIDWKVSDPALHLRYTGVRQDIILRHVRQLAAGNTPFILRMPIIPGINDNEAHFRTAAALVQDSESLIRVDVLPYQRAAGAKYEMVGMRYAPDFAEEASPRFFTEVFEQSGIPYQIFR